MQPSQPPEEPYETYHTANKHKETQHRENQQVSKKQQNSDHEHLQALCQNLISSFSGSKIRFQLSRFPAASLEKTGPEIGQLETRRIHPRNAPS